MKLEINTFGKIKAYSRTGTSDLKTLEEVIGRDIYQKRGHSIHPGQFWYDCGGNIGAFSLLALSKGAEVEIFEPDPFNCEMIEKNLKLNKMSATVNQVALVHNDIKEATLFCGKNGNFWRNSLLKNWCGKGVKVRCVKFDDVLKENACVKMDIEGAEMPIIESTALIFDSLIFEWSFDIDPNLKRYWRCLEKLKSSYDVKADELKSTIYDTWQKNWFPPCRNVFCKRLEGDLTQ